MNQSQGGAAEARRVHTPEVVGSIPALATIAPLACRSHAVSSELAPALSWPGIFFAGIHTRKHKFFCLGRFVKWSQII